jgi:hypothetical protein
LDPNDKEGTFDLVAWKEGRETILAEGRADQSDPAVSPYGSGRMVWRSWREDGYDLELRDEQGTVKPITFDSSDEIRTSPTHDGKSVFYHVVSPEGDDDLFRVDLEPHNSVVVSMEKEVDESWPVCSGDGSAAAWTNFDRRGSETETILTI